MTFTAHRRQIKKGPPGQDARGGDASHLAGVFRLAKHCDSAFQGDSTPFLHDFREEITKNGFLFILDCGWVVPKWNTPTNVTVDMPRTVILLCMDQRNINTMIP
jgi:hypothetical protein